MISQERRKLLVFFAGQRLHASIVPHKKSIGERRSADMDPTFFGYVTS
jgi:hypothetical protein